MAGPSDNRPAGCGRMIALRVYRDGETLAAAVADRLRTQALAPRKDPAAIMLAGGSTPLAAYRIIAAAPFPLPPALHWFFSDDRHVPPTDARSNFGAARPMLDALRVPPASLLRVQGEEPLPEAVRLYQEGLQHWLAEGVGLPLGFLGLGPDGHTASLFSTAHLEQARGRLALGVQRPDGLQGVSVTPELLARVRSVIVLVCGAEKRSILRDFLHETATTTAGRALENHRGVEVWCDAAAAPHGPGDTPCR